MKRWLPILVCLVAALFALNARAVERNFAGSAQFDWLLVPTQPQANARAIAFDGFTTEVALKLAVDVTDKVSANVKVCFACHGFEAGMAYFDLRLADEFNVRIGRFSPSFGHFNLRHDPANHRLSTKPLPYDMGRMLRMREWNLGVLPSPFPDNGVELNGAHWFGEKVQLDYAAYAVSGFKADADATDLDFLQSRTGNLYYVDNNARPTVGARLALTLKLGESSDMTLGTGAMWGTFDPKNHYSYGIFGGDLAIRLHRTNLRFEYLVRRQEFDASDPTRFRYVIPPGKGADFFAKHGAYVEVEHPLTKAFDLIARFDTLYRAGNVLVNSPLQRESSIFRATLGTSVVLNRAIRLKTSVEAYRFSDADARGKKLDLAFHLGVVGTY